MSQGHNFNWWWILEHTNKQGQTRYYKWLGVIQRENLTQNCLVKGNNENYSKKSFMSDQGESLLDMFSSLLVATLIKAIYSVIRWIGLKVVPIDRLQVFSIPGVDFLLKIITPSCWTIEKTTRCGISFGSHLQNAECEPRIILIHRWMGKLWAVQTIIFI